MLSKFKRKIESILLRLIFPHSEISMEKRFIKEAYHFYSLLSKYNASHHTDEDMEKMQYTLLRENHVIEKGMSMRNPRKGFGQKNREHSTYTHPKSRAKSHQETLGGGRSEKTSFPEERP